MFIKDIYGGKKPVVSFEVFPPKEKTDIRSIYSALTQMSGLSPDFISVTYGAGGSAKSGGTGDIAAFIQNERGLTALAHLTCVGSKRETISALLDGLEADEVCNVLALRGDLPENREPGDYKYAGELIEEIARRGGFCIGAACYPEGHIDCSDLSLDIDRLLMKQEAGADFLITQLFFDNSYFFEFLERARARGVNLPISAGVMPILSRSQIERMIFMCGASLPSGIIKLLHRYADSPADLRAAGIEYAAEQLADLKSNGAEGVHIYTMNRPEIAEYCIGRLEETPRG